MPKTTIPNIQWYAKISETRGVTIRCPFATVETCPRYYQSLSLLGKAGSTEIQNQENNRLLAKWEASDLWPRTDEYATSLFSRVGESPTSYSHFCPEVTYDRFGYFATQLSRYVDEIDRDHVFQHLKNENIPLEDPRWSWFSVSWQHYTECSLYAVLAHRFESAKGRNEGSVTHNYAFNAGVGIVQTGTNANANIVLGLSADQRNELLAALAQVRESLASSSRPDSQTKELLEIADETKEIITSNNPNSTKLRAYFDILSSAVQGIANAQPAYQSLKIALQALGITLP